MINKIVNALKQYDKVVIMAHIFPDGDGLGASLALGLALKSMGKDAQVLLEDDIPELYNFLPGKELINRYFEDFNNFSGEYLAVALDSGDRERLGKRITVFDAAKHNISIDHHITNTYFAEVNHVLPNASSTGEMIYDILKTMSVKLDKDIATCLYVAISTDTGGFRFSSTTADTHETVAALIRNGADVSELSQRVFESESLQRVRLLGHAMQNIQLIDDGTISIVNITPEMLEITGAKDEDCEKVANLARTIRGVQVAAMIRPRGDELKISLRSKNIVDVSKIAAKFLGGGHARAAGCSMRTDAQTAIDKIVQEIREAMRDSRVD